MSGVTRLSGVLDRRLSRRGFVVRAAFAGSALAAGGTDHALTPGRAHASGCYRGNVECGCDSVAAGTDSRFGSGGSGLSFTVTGGIPTFTTGSGGTAALTVAGGIPTFTE